MGLNNDIVEHPEHYTLGGIECIDGIDSALGPHQFAGYLKGNIIKYIWRSEHKGNYLEDLKKARWYLNKLIEQEERLQGVFEQHAD